MSFLDFIPIIGDVVQGITTNIQNNRNQHFQYEQQEDAQAFNSQEAQKNRDFQSQQQLLQNQFQRDMQDSQNQWNLDIWNKTQSPQAQIANLRQAGLNPNLFTGGSVGSVQSVGISANAPVSGSPASSGMLGSATPNPWDFSNIADSYLKIKQAQKTEAETEAQWTYNKFAEAIHQKNLELNDAQKHNLYSASLVNSELVNKTKEETAKLKIEANKLGVEIEGMKIDNLWKDEKYRVELENVMSQTGLNEIQCKVLLAKLPAELSLLHANAELLSIQKELSKHEIAQVDAIVEGLGIDNDQKRFDYVTNLMYGRDERLTGLKIAKASLSSGEYQNTYGYRILDGAAKFAGAVGTVAAAYLFKGKVGPVTPSSTPTNRVNIPPGPHQFY